MARPHCTTLLAVALLSAGASATVKMPYVITESGLELYSANGQNTTQPAEARSEGVWWPRPWLQRVLPLQVDYANYSTDVRNRIREDIARFNNQSCLRVWEVDCSSYQNSSCIRLSPTRRQASPASEVLEPGMPATAGTSHYIVSDFDVRTNGLLRHVAALAGLPCEHNRPDRDRFLVLNATDDSRLAVFAKDEKSFLSESQYDFQSATHVPYDVARNLSGVELAPAKSEGQRVSGQSVPLTIARSLSAKDISRIGRIYNCTTTGAPQASATDVGGAAADTTIAPPGNSSVSPATDSTLGAVDIDTGKTSGSAGLEAALLPSVLAAWTLWSLVFAPDRHRYSRSQLLFLRRLD